MLAIEPKREPTPENPVLKNAPMQSQQSRRVPKTDGNEQEGARHKKGACSQWTDDNRFTC